MAVCTYVDAYIRESNTVAVSRIPLEKSCEPRTCLCLETSGICRQLFISLTAAAPVVDTIATEDENTDTTLVRRSYKCTLLGISTYVTSNNHRGVY